MGRVAWTRLSGDEVEEVVAILVSREHPRAERIRPSQGDGGIDVLLPLDGGTFQVLQVKKFAENLTASQKTQIEKSFNRLVSYAKSRGMRVSGWSLVTPLDRTKENLEWLESVTKAADFDIEWRGLPYVEGLVSKYPEVIDYYLHDGKDRLEAAVSSLSSLLRFHASRDATPGNYQVADSMATLHTLHAEINRYDPHYRYDVSVESDTTEASQPDIPGLVCTVQQSDGRSRVTVKVIARFSDAVHVRPIPLSVMIRAEQGSELETALEEFGAFGTPVTVPPENVEFSLDLPGGLGVSDTSGEFSIFLPRSNTAVPLQFSILDSSSELLADTEIVFHTSTRGQTGAEIYGSEEGGVFDIMLRLVFPNQLSHFNIHVKDFSGRKLETVLPGLRFLANCHNSNKLRIFDPFTGVEAALGTLGVGTVGDAEMIVKCVEDLIALQGAAKRRIPVPDFTTVRVEDALDWARAARLVRGDAVDVTWNEIAVPVTPGQENEFDERFPGALLIRHRLTICVSGVNYDLGLCQFWTSAAQVRRTDGAIALEDGKALVEPMDGSKAVMRLVEPDDVSSET
ncbi:hypothetical protein [Streptomyces bobili]|uniref:Restriction endonuclease n=1 Tax=Streptomyces bobili TaxID=67280 RepID=A0ABZ1R365_9ACTN|nr:hypothetical protein [Streptomyces bobili]